MSGPLCESGHKVHFRVTCEPAAAVAWSFAGCEPMIPPAVQPPHWRSGLLTSSIGPFPWTSRMMRSGFGEVYGSWYGCGHDVRV